MEKVTITKQLQDYEQAIATTSPLVTATSANKNTSLLAVVSLAIFNK
jgi:hypothetical protein